MLPVTALAQECAAFVAPSTMAAIVQVESGGNPLAMWNNTTKQRILPANLLQAQAYLAGAMAAGDKVDVGIAQVDSDNFVAYGLNLQNAFDPCTNLRVGAEILKSGYLRATRHFGPGQLALYHAFEAYNSGALWGDSAYANRVLRAAGIPVSVQGNFLPVAHWQAPFASSWAPRSNWLSSPK